MKIYTKTAAIISTALVGLILLFFFISTAIVLGGFTEIEEQDATENMERLVYALADDINTLNAVTKEWANREETRSIVRRTYINHLSPFNYWNQLDDTLFERLGVNVIMVHDANGKLVASRAYNLTSHTSENVPYELLEKARLKDPLVKYEDSGTSVLGLVILKDGPMLIASQPIHQDDTSSRIIGSFVMGRFLDESVIKRLNTLTTLPVSVQVIEREPALPELFSNPEFNSMPFIQQSAGNVFTVDAPLQISPINDQVMEGYILIKDIYGDPALIMSASMPRDIYAEGKTSTTYSLLYMFGGFLAFSVMIVLLLEITVLSRLSFLNSRVSTIGSQKDFSARVEVSGNDEVSSLAQSINWMLADLEDSQLILQDRLNETEERYRLFFNSGNDLVLVYGIKRDGTPSQFIDVNESAAKQLGYTKEEMKELTPAAILPPEQMKKFPEILEQILEKGHVLYETEFVSKNGWVVPVEVNAHFFEHMGWTAVLSMARDVTERREIEKVKRDAFQQIEKNMEQFAILNDHVRNPLQVIVGLALLNAEDDGTTDKILGQAQVINEIVDQLDQGWIESEKIRDWLRKYYGFE